MYRKQCYKTQSDLAEELNVSSKYISAIERGKRSIALDNVQKIADALEIDTYLLFVDNDSKNIKEMY